MPACLWWLAVGAFAIGTEGYLIAGILPLLSRDLHVTIETAGQLMALFSITYALAGPLGAAATANVERRRVLTVALAAFALANIVAAGATSFTALAAARVLLAVTAALYLPSASAVAATIVTPDRRGRAIAIVAGGGTVAIALGVPFGAWISSVAGWRATFFMVGVISALTAVGLGRVLAAGLPNSPVRLSDRLRLLAVPGVPQSLAVSLLWAAGGFSFFSYVAPYLESVLGLSPAVAAVTLSAVGAGAALGTAIGGHATDRFGATPVIRLSAAALIAILASLTMVPSWVAVPLWAVAGWAFGPAQASRLVRLAPANAAVILSLHGSAVHLGIAAGSLLGGFAIQQFGLPYTGMAGALCQVAGLLLLLNEKARRPLIEDSGLLLNRSLQSTVPAACPTQTS